MAGLDRDALRAALDRFAARELGPDMRVESLAPMESGHAGLTFGVTFSQRRDFVLRLAPPGVRRQGNTDVYRQVPLLRALGSAGLPVPAVPFAEAGEATLGTPFILMERLPGRTFFIWQPDITFACWDTSTIWLQAAEVLRRLHAFDWRRDLPEWEPPRPLAEDVTRWDKVLAKTPDPAWVERGQRLRDRLLATLPQTRHLGLCHGDFQPGNLLFDNGRLTGIIDWELSHIGDQMLDLGWLLMMGDTRSWHPRWMPQAPLAPEALAETYAKRSGRSLDRLAWYRAAAGYAFATITCMNLHLHRSGRRPDPTWEDFAHAIPALFGRAEELI